MSALAAHRSLECSDDLQSQRHVTDTFIFGILIIGSALNQVTIILLAFLLFYKVLFKSYAYTFYILLFLVPSLGATLIPNIPVPLLNLLVPIALFKLILLKGVKFDKHFFIWTFIFIAYECLHVLLYNANNLMTLAGWICTILYFALFIFNNKIASYKNKLAIKYFLSGIFISILYGLLNNYLKTGTVINLDQTDLTVRFSGGAGDPNYYSLYILIGLFSLLKFFHNKSTQYIKKPCYLFISVTSHVWILKPIKNVYDCL